MNVYSVKNAARLLDLSVDQVRSYARDGLLTPERGPRGEYRFSFQDLVLLRTAKGLLAARIRPRKVRTALRRLREQLPTDWPLTGIKISAEGDHVVARSGDDVWDPETGQKQFNFDGTDPRRRVSRHPRRTTRRIVDAEDRTAEEWYLLASELEATAPEQAQELYRRALDLDPAHFHTRVNLGRLLHETGRLHAAEAHYRLALAARPAEPTALFNLAVCLEDLGRTDEAIRIYHRTIDVDPDCADAHYNLARLHEALGDAAAALRHLKVYRRLVERI